MEPVATFRRGRNESEFALIIHTAVGVGKASLGFIVVGQRTVELNQK